jgi:hypothetical protein
VANVTNFTRPGQVLSAEVKGNNKTAGHFSIYKKPSGICPNGPSELRENQPKKIQGVFITA